MKDMTTIEMRAGEEDDLFDKVCEQLMALSPPGVGAGSLSKDTLLLEELGLDSLKFVDLTVALETMLEVPEFPMQEWIDAQLEAGRALTVGQLVIACQRVSQAASGGTSDLQSD